MSKLIPLLFGAWISLASASSPTQLALISTESIGSSWFNDLTSELRALDPNLELLAISPARDQLPVEPWVATDAASHQWISEHTENRGWLIAPHDIDSRAHHVLTQSPQIKRMLAGLATLTDARQIFISEQSQASTLYSQARLAVEASGWEIINQPMPDIPQLLLSPSERSKSELTVSPWRHHIGTQAQLGGVLDGTLMGRALLNLLNQPDAVVSRRIQLVTPKLRVDNAALDEMGLDWHRVGTKVIPIDGERLEQVSHHRNLWLLFFAALACVTLFGLAAQNYRQRRSKSRLNRLLVSDRNTGLLNRDGFIARAEARLNQHPGQAHAVISCHFDGVVQMTGDELSRLIQQVAERLMGSARQDDLLARTGQVSFGLMINSVSLEHLGQTLDKYCEALRMPFFLDQQSIDLSAGLGVSLTPNHASSVADCLSLADTTAKTVYAIGEVNWTLFNPESEDPSQRQQALLKDLTEAIKNDSLNLVYQPIVLLTDQRIIGVESLLRWKHPQLGAISPPEIISIARNGGILKSLGDWVIRTATQQATRWQRLGLELKVNVNVTAEQFVETGFVAQIQQLLFETGLGPHLLTLEITEDATVENPAHAAQALERLASIGVHTAIDDFGTGYSSLSRLKQFKLSALKIDRSFVMDLGIDNQDHAINRAIIQIAHSMGLSVVAEGIENTDQLKFLIDEGCDFGQGYLFSKPVEAHEIHALISQPLESKSA